MLCECGELGECGVLGEGCSILLCTYMCVYVSVWSWVCVCVGVVMGVCMCRCGHGCKSYPLHTFPPPTAQVPHLLGGAKRGSHVWRDPD